MFAAHKLLDEPGFHLVGFGALQGRDGAAGEAKVGEFELVVRVDEDVLAFEVAVRHLGLFVEVFDAHEHLEGLVLDFIFLQGVGFALEVAEEVPVFAVL